MGDGHGEFESGKRLQVSEAALEFDPLRGCVSFGAGKGRWKL